MKVVKMEKFSRVIIMLIVIDMAFKSNMVEGGRGIKINNEKVVYQPQNFPGLPPIFPNWNFPGQQSPGQPNSIPGFPGFPGIPVFGFPPPSPGGGDSSPQLPGFNAPWPLFPFSPYFRYDPPKFCLHLVACIPLPKFPFPPTQATPVLSPPPDQGPLAPTVQPSPTNPSTFQPPSVQSPPAQTSQVSLPMAQTPAVQSASISPVGQLPTVPTPALQAEALTPPSSNP